MKLAGVILGLIAVLVIGIYSPTYAHPGRTASDGCHYCRTNCDSWGVPYNDRHCHGGGSVEAPPPVQGITDSNPPTNTPFPTRIALPTKRPANTPTAKPKYVETEMDKKKFFKVTSVVDGDTIKVNIRGKVESIRLLAIDTPETVDPRKFVQCFGKEATTKMKSILSGKFVKLIDDKSQGNRDKYGRLLRYAYLEDGTFVNAQMVKEGYAFSYKEYPTKYLNDFNNLEKQAREKNLGLWNSCK